MLGLVIHDTEGGLQGSLAALRAPYDSTTGRGGASAHYVIAEDGAVFQLVHEEDIAFHVAAFGSQPQLNRNRPSWLPTFLGRWSAVNQYTIGYELVGFAASGFTAEQYQSLGELCAAACARWQIPPTLEPDHSTDAHIVTHGFLQTDRSDPGPHFDWDALKAAMGEQDEMACQEELAVVTADRDRANAIKQEFEAVLRDPKYALKMRAAARKSNSQLADFLIAKATQS